MNSVENTIEEKVMAAVRNVKTTSTEPGVEKVDGLSSMISATVQDAAASGRDMAAVCRSIIVGAFRGDRAVPLEAHKTIRLLISQILGAAQAKKGEDAAVKGILSGIEAAAREHELNEQEALLVAKEDVHHFLEPKEQP